MYILVKCVSLTYLFLTMVVEADPIRGGSNVLSPNSYPFMASLQEKKLDGPENFCGGSIIDKRHILTAAHCLTKVFREDVIVVVGTIEKLVFNDNNKYEVQNWVKNEKFDQFKEFSTDKDIGLIRVDREIVFSDTVQKIPLDLTNSVKEKDDVVIIGFGFSGYKCDRETKYLQELHTSIVDPRVYVKDGDENYDVEDDLVLCTYCNKKDEFEHDNTEIFSTCLGDSGGPVISYKTGKAVLVGVLSSGSRLHANAVKVYSSLDAINSMKESLSNYV